MTRFTCDLGKTSAASPHVWEHTVGSGHAPLALRADWQRQLRRCHQELGFRHVRFHGLLSDPMGTLVEHGDELVYSFFNANQIIDFLLELGMKPFLELSFMPAPLAQGGKTVFSYQSLVTPPEDLGKWGELIRRLVVHWIARYGKEEVRNWYFEVWNEPNLTHFWTGSRQAYFDLYRTTVEAIKGVDASLRVGGPATAQNEWLEPFLNFCEEEGVPADFVTTHYYPTDAFGEVGEPTEQKLAEISPGVMAKRARAARATVGEKPLFYTEWNVASNPRHRLHDLPFAAAFATYIMMSVREFVQGYSYWTFSDIFEELYFPSEPFHGGFGLLTLHGIAKPVYRAFELLHRLGERELPVRGEHDTVSVWAFPTEGELIVLLVNLAMPEQEVQVEVVDLKLERTPRPAAAFLERIDEGHANPRPVWEAMGAPTYPDRRQLEALETASRLVEEPLAWTYDAEQNTANVSIQLRPQSVTAVTIRW